MKRFIFILLILITLCSVFTVSIFAENEDSAYDDGAKAGANLAQGLNQAKEELWGFLEQTWDFIMSDETYKDLANAILGILAFIFIPIIAGVVVFSYIILAVVALILDVYIWAFEMLFGFSISI